MRIRDVLIAFAALLLFSGCSVKSIAVRSLADGLGAGGGGSFTSEGDLELVEGALPFSLKAMESLLGEAPDHGGLHLSLAQGYMLYAYGFIDMKADEVKDKDFSEYQRLRGRARSFYYRAFQYARAGLDLCSKDFEKASQKNLSEALLLINKKDDVPYLYWTGAALAKWITLGKTDPSAAVRLPEAAAYMQRAFDLDPGYDYGAIHEFFISYEARGAVMGGDMKRAEEHFRQACALAGDRKISPLLTYLEACSIPGQNKKEFELYLKQVAEFDADRHPDLRLVNTLAKKRAAYLIRKKDDLFLGD